MVPPLYTRGSVYLPLPRYALNIWAGRMVLTTSQGAISLKRTGCKVRRTTWRATSASPYLELPRAPRSAAIQGLTLVDIRAQLEQLQDTFMNFKIGYTVDRVELAQVELKWERV
jgi:hypothetical protein